MQLIDSSATSTSVVTNLAEILSLAAPVVVACSATFWPTSRFHYRWIQGRNLEASVVGILASTRGGNVAQTLRAAFEEEVVDIAPPPPQPKANDFSTLLGTVDIVDSQGLAICLGQ